MVLCMSNDEYDPALIYVALSCLRCCENKIQHQVSKHVMCMKQHTKVARQDKLDHERRSEDIVEADV
jgi:hypothetical protein